MNRNYGVALITGSLALYSSMTCIYNPVALMQQTGAGETVNLISQKHNLKVLQFKNTTGQPGQNLPAEKKPEVKNQEDSEVQEEPGFLARLFASDKKEEPVLKLIKNHHHLERPNYTKGIYLSNNTIRMKARMDYFIKSASIYRLNTFVIDVQPRMVKKEPVARLLKAGIFPVARVVVFEGGLKAVHPSEAHLQRVFTSMKQAAAAGFKEVQLDYIRYADSAAMRRVALKTKYTVIEGILKRASVIAKAHNIELSADVFGRITLNRNDHIGQRLENFATHMQTIYPMVYPSHYSGDKFRISHPYETVKEGVFKSKARIKNARIVAYIQGFTWKVPLSGLSLSEYIRKQVKACEDAGGDGYIIWNPRNAYGASFKGIARHYALKKRGGQYIAQKPAATMVLKKVIPSRTRKTEKKPQQLQQKTVSPVSTTSETRTTDAYKKPEEKKAEVHPAQSSGTCLAGYNCLNPGSN